MNRTCKEEEDLLYQKVYIGEQSLCCFTSVAAVVLHAYNASKYRNEMRWHVNTKYLMIYTMFVCVWMASTGAYNYGHYLFNLVYKTNPCDMLMQVRECGFIRFSFLMTFDLITLLHVAVICVVAIATWNPVKFEQKKEGPFLSMVLIFAMTCFSAIVVFVVRQSEDPDELVPHCLSLSASQLGNAMYLGFGGQLTVETLVIISALLLKAVNKKGDSPLMYMKKDGLSSKFQSRENNDVLEKLFPSVVVTAGIIFGYLNVAMYVRIIKDLLSKNTYIIVTFLVFMPPHLPLITAIMINIMLSKHVDDKKKNHPSAIVNKWENNQCGDSLTMSWDTAFTTRHGGNKKKKMKCCKNKISPVFVVTEND